MQKFTIRSDEAGQRMDKYLHKLLKNAPSSFYYKMLRKKNITLNGKKADGTETLQLGDEVSCFFSDETFEKFAGFAYSAPNASNKQNHSATSQHNIPVSDEIRLYQKAYDTLKDLQIVYEDQDVLLLNKPINVLSQQANKGDLSANEWFLGYLLHKGIVTPETLRTFKPSVVNRLDRNTTGLLICGKTLRGSQKMCEIVRDRSLHKYYLAVVAGSFQKKQQYEGFLVKDEKTNRVQFYASKDLIPANLRADASAILTSFEPVKATNNYSVVRVLLHTGKTHQIRAHLSALGHPILGDPKYGNSKKNQEFRVKNQLLHSYELQFPYLEGMKLSEQTITCNPPRAFLPFLD